MFAGEREGLGTRLDLRNEVTYHKEKDGPSKNTCIAKLDSEEQLGNGDNLVEHDSVRKRDDQPGIGVGLSHQSSNKLSQTPLT